MDRNPHVHDSLQPALDRIAGSARTEFTEAELLAAERARNVNKAERMAERAAEWALDAQIRFQDAMGVPA
jgi:hypothetical protein